MYMGAFTMPSKANATEKTHTPPESKTISPPKSGVSSIKDSPVYGIFNLQRKIGNQAVQRLLYSGVLQFKPAVAVKSAGTAGQGNETIQRAYFNVGSVTIQIDYGVVNIVAPAFYVSNIETRFTNWTGSPATIIDTDLAALTAPQQQWVLFGLDLLMRNTTTAHASLDKTQAVQRLITYAPSATTQPLSGGLRDFSFEKEVLRVSGWFEPALTAPLTAPTGNTLTAITSEYNPPPGANAPAGGVLDSARLGNEIPPALITYLNQRDPANWAATGTQSLSTLQPIADLIQAEARTFFAPYADTAMSNQYSANWVYSAHLVSTSSITPTQSQRINYLLNRAEIVGRRDKPGGSIFANCNYDSGRSADRAELLNIVTTMEADPAIQATVNRLIQQTGRTNRSSGPTVSVPTEYDSATYTEFEARWKSIRTLAHELVHVLVHPSFPAQANNVRFGQIIREGFTEILGVQLYDQLRAGANADANFKSQLEAGITGSATLAPPATTIRYGDAGLAAERIRNQVQDDNFRAAYFLGALNLVGL
jgi:hypothetical protein